MFISAVLAHPRPGSLTHAIAGTVVGALRKNGHDCAFHDICTQKNSIPCCRMMR